jgi:hypothetical protein
MTHITIITDKHTIFGETDRHVDEITRLIHSCCKEQNPLRIDIDQIMYVIPFGVLDNAIIKLEEV